MLSSLASYLWGAAEPEPIEGTTAADSSQDARAEGSPVTQQGSESPRLKTRPADNEWVLVDKTRSSSSKRMETSSMENLLIEHPSMSVYSHRGRQSSTGVDSEGSASETESPETTQVGSRRGVRRAGPARHEPPRRSHALAARVGLTQVQLVKSMQKSQQRHLYKNLSSNRIMRSNIVREVGSQGSRKLRNHHVHQPTKRSHTNKQY